MSQFHFLQFQKWPKINFLTGENCQKCNFTKKNFISYLISRVFCLDFFKFSGPLCRSVVLTSCDNENVIFIFRWKKNQYFSQRWRREWLFHVFWIKMMWSHQWNWHKRNKIFETHDAFLARPTIEHQRRTVYVLLTAL